MIKSIWIWRHFVFTSLHCNFIYTYLYIMAMLHSSQTSVVFLVFSYRYLKGNYLDILVTVSDCKRIVLTVYFLLTCFQVLFDEYKGGKVSRKDSSNVVLAGFEL